MFCTNCGTQNDDNAKFCINCGAKLDTDIPSDKVDTENLNELSQSDVNELDKLNKADSEGLDEALSSHQRYFS